MDIHILENAFNKAKLRIVKYFEILGGKETSSERSKPNLGLRRVGSEFFLQAEFYSWLKKNLPENILTLHLHPFAGLEDYSEDLQIDLAIFKSFDSLNQLPPIADVWVEIKNTGGHKLIKETFTNAFKKFLEIAKVYNERESNLPSVILTVIFFESSNELFSEEVKLANFLEPELIQATPAWFKDLLYECILWREKRKWVIKKSFD